MSDNNEEEKENKRRRAFFIYAAIFIVFLIAIFTTIYILSTGNKTTPGTNNNTDANNDPTETLVRKATLEDITIVEEEFDKTNSIEKLVFIPNRDIEKLQITFDYMDGIKSKRKVTEYVGNVEKNQQYTITIVVDPFNFYLKDIKDFQYKFYVSGGTTNK